MRITVPEAARRFGAAPSSTSAALFVALVASVLGSLSSLPGCLPQKGTIGAVIAQDDDSGRLFLREVPPDLAAARADLKVGDEILLIDGLDVRFMDAKQINTALVGEVDSPVKLTMIRGEQVLRVTLKRTEARRLLTPRNKS
ncbi:MAG: PDZ domain-containing protein [Polyangiaceae bacterium]